MEESDGDGLRSRWRSIAPALWLLLLTLIAYQPATEAGFVWDDDANLTHNLPLRSGAGLKSLWLEPGATTQYYPLVYTSFWLEYAAWELEPFGYHVDNILLHAIGAILLWRILIVMALPGAWFAAAVFALHPVQVESVAWVTERKNVLSGVFYLAAALTYLRFVSDAFVDPRQRAKRWGYLLAIGLFVAALLSKSPTATLPAALLLAVWWKKGRLSRNDILPTLPFFALGAPIALLTTSMEKYVGTFLGLEWNPGVLERMLQAGRAAVFYATKLVWPMDLSFVYSRWAIDITAASQYLYPLAVIIALAACIGLRDRVGRGPLTALLYFGGTLFPVLGLLEIYYFRFSFVADHWQYLACIGPIVLFCCGGAHLAARLSSRNSIRAVAFLMIGVIGILGALTFKQSRNYHDIETLWIATLEKNPDSAMVNYNLANEVAKRGKVWLAVKLYRRSIELEPENAKPYNNLAMLHLRRGDRGSAERYLYKAIKVAPDYTKAHWNLGAVLLMKGRFRMALRHFELALELPLQFEQEEQDRLNSHFYLAGLLMKHNRPNRARGHLIRTLEMDPDHIPAHMMLGRMGLRSHAPIAAIKHFEHVLEFEPKHAAARQHLARATKLAELKIRKKKWQRHRRRQLSRARERLR